MVRVHTESLENLGNRPFFAKSQGKPGIVREYSIIFINIRESKLFSPHIMFINSRMAVRKVDVPFVVSKCELYHLT